MFYRQMRQTNTLPGLSIYLLTTDRHYYEYHRSLSRYQFTTGLEDPVKIYSNVKGGLGIFASYRQFRTAFIFVTSPGISHLAHL